MEDKIIGLILPGICFVGMIIGLWATRNQIETTIPIIKDQSYPLLTIIVSGIGTAIISGLVGSIYLTTRGEGRSYMDYMRQKLFPALNETTGFLAVSFVVIMCLANVIMKTAPKYMVSVDKEVEEKTTGFVAWLQSSGLSWLPIVLPVVIVSVMTYLPIDNKFVKIGFISASLLGVFMAALFFSLLKKLFSPKEEAFINIKEEFGHTDTKFLEEKAADPNKPDAGKHPLDLSIAQDLGIKITTGDHITEAKVGQFVKNINVGHWNDTITLTGEHNDTHDIFYSRNPHGTVIEASRFEKIPLPVNKVPHTIPLGKVKDNAWYFHRIPKNVYVFENFDGEKDAIDNSSYCIQDTTTGLWEISDPKPSFEDYYKLSDNFVKKNTIKKLSVITNLKDKDGNSKGYKILFLNDNYFTATANDIKVITDTEGSYVPTSEVFEKKDIRIDALAVGAIFTDDGTIRVESNGDMKMGDVQVDMYYTVEEYYGPSDYASLKDAALTAAKTAARTVKPKRLKVKTKQETTGNETKTVLDVNADGKCQLVEYDDSDFDLTKSYFIHIVRKGTKIFTYDQDSQLHEDTWYELNATTGLYDLYDYTDVPDKFADGFPITIDINANNENPADWRQKSPDITKLKAEDLICFWGDLQFQGFANRTSLTGDPLKKNGNHKTLTLSTAPSDIILSTVDKKNVLNLGSMILIKDQKFYFRAQLEAMKSSFDASYIIYYVTVWTSIGGYFLVTLAQGVSKAGKLFMRLLPFLIVNALETMMVSHSHTTFINKSASEQNIDDVNKISSMYTYAVGAYATRIATVVAFLSYILTHAKEG